MCFVLFCFFACAGARGPVLPGAVSVSHGAGEGGGHGGRHQEGHPPGPAHLLLHLLLAGWGGPGGGDEEVNTQTHTKTWQQMGGGKKSRSTAEVTVYVFLSRSLCAGARYVWLTKGRFSFRGLFTWEDQCTSCHHIHSLRHSLGSEQQRLGVVLPLHRRGEGERKFLFFILSHHNAEDVQRQIAAVQTVQH